MSLDHGIVLNLSSEKSTSNESKRRVTDRLRGKRIKLRKAARRAASRNNETSSDSKVESTSADVQILPRSSSDETNKRETKSTHGTGNKKIPSGQVISSLFRHNPPIPSVKQLDVESVKETIFSSDNFGALSLHPYLTSCLEKKLGLEKMTSVQKAAIPTVISGDDTLIKSQTGSGKTLTYAIPIVQSLQGYSHRVQRSDGPYALVIVPTRELALQSFDTFQKLVQPFLHIVPGCIVGGEKRKAEKARLRKGVNILVATPGRLLDHLQHTTNLTLSRIKWLVIDEADRLLDMGFERSISEIMEFLKKQNEESHQTVLLSATLSSGVEKLAGMTLTNPTQISITENQQNSTTDSMESEGETQFAVPENLKQHFIMLPCKLRLVTLTSFILQKCQFSKKKSKIIVFVSTQDSVEFHYTMLKNILMNKRREVTVDEVMSKEVKPRKEDQFDIDLHRLHGNMAQKERTNVYQSFVNAPSGVLFCTDVAARGLDLPNVNWIVQYTNPGDPTEYIHRVGRTARAGASGNSLLFLMPEEVKYLDVLNTYRISLEEMTVEGVLYNLLKLVHRLPRPQDLVREMPRTYEEAATYLQLHFENMVLTNKEFTQLARNAYISFIRAYATYPASLKEIFHVKHLHFGHLAKSFALRQPPKELGAQVTKQAKVKRQAEKAEKSKRLSAKRRAEKRKTEVSEFSGDLIFNKKKKKNN